jgi:hypothetical protein
MHLLSYGVGSKRGPTTTDSSPYRRFLSDLGRTLVAGAPFGRYFPLISARELERNMPHRLHGKALARHRQLLTLMRLGYNFDSHDPAL